jgi:hypothetical protein
MIVPQNINAIYKLLQLMTKIDATSACNNVSYMKSKKQAPVSVTTATHPNTIYILTFQH